MIISLILSNKTPSFVGSFIFLLENNKIVENIIKCFCLLIQLNSLPIHFCSFLQFI